MSTALLDDYRTLVAEAGAVWLDRDVVRVSGPGAVSYLQGQISQEVDTLAVGHSAWSLVLQPQGRVDAWVRITRTGEDEVMLDVDGGFGDALVSRLARFKLRVKADIDVVDWRCLAVRGPAAVRPEPAATGIVAQAVWPLVGGWDLLGPDPCAPTGVPLIAVDAYEVRRIEAGLPRMGAELTERTIPAEAGIVDVSASFTKGCYTGQELVARIDSRGGHVPRRLRGVLLPVGAPVPAPGTDVEVDGRARGTITSAARHPDGGVVALGYVARDVEPPAEGVCDGAAAAIRVVPPE